MVRGVISFEPVIRRLFNVSVILALPVSFARLTPHGNRAISGDVFLKSLLVRVIEFVEDNFDAGLIEALSEVQAIAVEFPEKELQGGQDIRLAVIVLTDEHHHAFERDVHILDGSPVVNVQSFDLHDGAASRTSIFPVTAAEIRAVRSSRSLSMDTLIFSVILSNLPVSASRNLMMRCRSSNGGTGNR